MTTSYLIPETIVDGQRLGRHVMHDDRSASYPAAKADAIESVAHASHGLPLNQGNVGSCTAEALIGCCNTDPDFPSSGQAPYTQADAYKLYGAEVTLEGKHYPPDDPGGTGLEVCKAAVNMGLITGYGHEFNADDALRALALRAGIFGCHWYDSMDTPDDKGVVTIGANAKVRGGHEVMAYGLDAENELIWFWNSWGPTWGQGGRFAMSFATADRLFHEDGDIIFPVK